MSGAVPVAVTLDQSGNGWSCDVEKIAAAVTPRTKAIFINTPSNPTGWTADHETLQAILDLARARNLWIIADEIYSLFHYGQAARRPSSTSRRRRTASSSSTRFSKNWAMTGWRVGWIKTHPSLQQVFENLIQYSTSGVAQFMQRGAVAALDEGDAFIAEQVERARQARDLVCGILGATGRARFTVPQGAFYLFFSVDGITDSTHGRLRHRRQGQCRPGARHRLRSRRRSLPQAVLPPPPRPGRGGGAPAGKVDEDC